MERNISKLRAAILTCGANLHVLTTDAELENIGRVLGATDCIRFLNPYFHRQLVSEIRWTPEEAEKSKDGLDLSTLELTPAQSAGLRLLRRPNVAALLREIRGGDAFQDIAVNAFRTSAAAVLVIGRSGDCEQVLRGGRAIQRLWLEATALGLSVQPWASHYMYDAAHYFKHAAFDDAELTSLFDLEERFEQAFAGRQPGPRLLLFRLFHSRPPSARSLRLPIEDILRTGRPPSLNR